MKLYLVQHGEAYAKDEQPERPLTERGREDVQRLAAFLHRAQVQVGRVIHSGKLRARQTAGLLAQAIAPGVALESSGLINPNDNPAAFDWQGDSWDQDTVIVGHLPFMAKMVSQLLLEDQDKIIAAYRPGSVVCLEHADDGAWQLAWMIRPELLR